jgi:hypothetical protein
MSWHMLHFSDLQRQPLPAQLLDFAIANLDSAEALCEEIRREPHTKTYAHGSVVMSLTFHSLELYFKGGILKQAPNEQFGGRSGHDLDVLSRRFFKLNPKKEFQFEVPFRREAAEPVGELTPEDIAELKAYAAEYKLKVPEDQRHRYPMDTEGNAWEGVFGFEPNSFVCTIRELNEIYARTIPVLKAG